MELLKVEKRVKNNPKFRKLPNGKLGVDQSNDSHLRDTAGFLELAKLKLNLIKSRSNTRATINLSGFILILKIP